MKTITTIGIDLAKNSFSVYGVPVFSRSLTRAEVVRFFTNLPSVLWVWKPMRLGVPEVAKKKHDGKMVGPAFGKPGDCHDTLMPLI